MKKTKLNTSLEAWKKTASMIEACRKAGDCKAGPIAEGLGDRCGDLEKERDDSRWNRTVYRFCPMPTHTELIDWFCDPRPGKSVPGMVYLGDREIILGKLDPWNERHVARCEVENENGADDLTYEPYAIMVARPSPHETA